VGAYLLTSSQEDNDDKLASPVFEGPATMVFNPTGEYIGGNSSIRLVVHAFTVTPQYTAVSYTIVGSGDDAPRSVSLRLVDDLGRDYRTLGNANLGAVHDALGGILVSEAHISGGSILTLEASAVELESGEIKTGNWSIPVLRTSEPGSAVSFIEAGHLSPEEGVQINGATVGIAGPPGAFPTEILIQRAGNESNLFGDVSADGSARALSATQFEGQVGSGHYPRPPAFPQTAAGQ
jgi:hypothetical protein